VLAIDDVDASTRTAGLAREQYRTSRSSPGGVTANMPLRSWTRA